MRRRGLTLMEMVVCLCLVVLIMPLAFNLIPGGLYAQSRAEDLEAASAYAGGWVEEAIHTPPAPGTESQNVTLGRLRYHATRQTMTVDGFPELLDVVVTLTAGRGQPIVIASRIRKP